MSRVRWVAGVDGGRTRTGGWGLAGRVVVVPDVEAAWLAATRGRPGVVVVAGTGSVAYGRDARGRSARAHDGRGPATALVGALAAALGAKDPGDLIPRVYGGGPAGGVLRGAPAVYGAFARAVSAAGARTVAVTAGPRSPLALGADLAVCLEVGPEVLAGSSRLKAGTAQKLVLNMISTAGMGRLGKAYRQWMVDALAARQALEAGGSLRTALGEAAQATGSSVPMSNPARGPDACGWTAHTLAVGGW